MPAEPEAPPPQHVISQRDLTVDLVESLSDAPLRELEELRQRRRALRRVKKRSRAQEEEFARLDAALRDRIGHGFAARQGVLERRELDALAWRLLRPSLIALRHPRKDDSPKLRGLRKQLDLEALRTFTEGFTQWWFERGRQFLPLDSPAHAARSKALEGLQAAGIVDEELGKFLGLVQSLRWPVDVAFAEWIAEKVTATRKRGADQRVVGVLGKIARLVDFGMQQRLSPSYVERTKLEAQRMVAARACLRLMAQRVATARPGAIVEAVDFLVARKVAVREACAIVAGLLADRRPFAAPDTPEAVRRLYYRTRLRS